CSLSRMTPPRGLPMPHDSLRTRRTQRTSLRVAFSRFLLGKIAGGLRSLILTVTTDLRIAGSNPVGRATLPKVPRIGQERENGWSPPGRQPTQNRAQSSGEGV